MRLLAAGLWLSIGGFHETGPDEAHVYNAHVIMDETGDIRSVYRKIHLFSYRPEDPAESVLQESNSTAPGTQVRVNWLPDMLNVSCQPLIRAAAQRHVMRAGGGL